MKLIRNIYFRILVKKDIRYKWQWHLFGVSMFAAGIVFSLFVLTEKVILPQIFAASVWTQSTWENGQGSSTVNQYSSGNNIDATSTVGQVSLEYSEEFTSVGVNASSDLDYWLGVDPSTMSSLVAFFKADAGVYTDSGSTAALDGQDVQQWNDLSGNGQHATAPSVSRRPTLNFDEINGRPALTFIQASDTANNDDALNATLNSVANLSNVTHFVVGSFDYTNQPANNYDYLFSVYDSTNPSASGVGSIARQAANGGNPDKYYAYYNGGALLGPTLTSGFKMYTQQFRSGAPIHYLWINRASQSVSAGSSLTTINNPRLTIGKWQNGTWALNGRVAEYMMFNTALDENQRHSVENYLNNKYNLGTSTLTVDTTIKRTGAGSAKVVSTSNTVELLQNVNVGDSSQYNLVAFAYTDGSVVTSSDIELYANGATITTSITDAGSGWYKLTGTVTGANAIRTYGVQIKANKTVYVDDFSLFTYVSSGTLTSNIFDTGQLSAWGDLLYTSSGSAVSLRVRTDTHSDMSGAPAFDSCDVIATGNDISSNNCVADGDRYIQYQINLSTVDATTSPTVSDISIGYDVFDEVAPTTNASSIIMKTSSDGRTIVSGSWNNAVTPYFSWTAGADNVGGSGLKGYCMYLGATEDSDPSTTSGLLTNSPVSTSGTTCGFIATGTSLDLSAGNYLSSTLTSGQTYYVYIKAIDLGNNTFVGSSASFEFQQDSTSPTNVTYISAPNTVFGNVADMSFSWPISGGGVSADTHSGVLGWQYSLDGGETWRGTSTDSTLGVTYIPSDGSTSSYDLTEGDDGSDISEGINTVYFRTVDRAGNISSSSSYRTAPLNYGGAAPSFGITCDLPTGVTVSPSTSTSNSFGLTWDGASATGGNTVSRYYYMINTSPPSTYSTLQSNSTQYISVSSGTTVGARVMTGAVKGVNTVYVVAVDNENNYSQSNCLKGQFTLNSTLPDPARSVSASDASIKSDELWRASVTWGVPAYAGTGALTYIVERSEDNGSWVEVTRTTGTSYTDTVPSSRTYYYRVGVYDTTAESIAAPTYTTSVSVYPKGTWDEAPTLSSGPTVTGITTKRATISWSTSRGADSRVQYGTGSGSYFEEEPSKSERVTSHEIKLVNLSPGTKYYYRVKWTDEDGNTGISDENTFTTDQAPVVTNPQVVSVGLSTATVEYTVSGSSKVRIYYGLTTAFGGTREISTATSETTYTTTIDGLNDGSLYYYKINTFDSEGDEYEGNNLTFQTLPRPRISNIEVEEVPGTAQPTVLVSWSTNTEVSSIITYYPAGRAEEARDEVSVTLKSGVHRMVLRGLQNETRYSMVVRGRDKVGNEAVSDVQSFTTATDTRPPQIVNMKVEGSTEVSSQGGQATAQLVVSWDTDEPSTSQVEIGEGTGTSYAQSTQEDRNMTTNHIVIISNLTPSKVYHLRAISRDSGGNTGYSLDTVTITPKSTDSALDLVVGNLSEVFGFLRGL